MAGPSAGYSSTPLARKLGIKPEHRLVMVDAPLDWDVPELPDGVETQRVSPAAARGPADVVLLFVRGAAELTSMQDFGEMIFPAGAIWVAWPRKAGGHVSDVAENDIRDAVLPLGLVDVKVAALDQDWSGLKIVWRKQLRVRTVPSPPAAASPNDHVS